MKDKIEQLKKQFAEGFGNVKTVLELDELEQRFFGRKSGKLSNVMKEMKDLAGDAKKQFGKSLNELKKEFQKDIATKKSDLAGAAWDALGKTEKIDITQPLLPVKEGGHIHPITTAMWRVEEVARKMGFLVEDGPELESDYYVFESLNIPKDHPARDTQDTFYIKGHPDQLMRSHVSNMQVRLMQKYGAPLRAAHPGRVFRNEALDATHGHTFYQFDAILVDRDITIGDLVGTIREFLRGIFDQDDMEVRIRPAHFPFVEPGFEMDMQVTSGRGKNEKTKWMEIVGCGMIHPNVIREGGLDTKEWDGFAFSLGLDRLVMAKYGIEDIRHIHSGDLRFLKQF